MRLRPAGAAGGKQTRAADPLGRGFDSVVKQRRAEADEFYAELTPEAAKPDEAMVMRQAFAGMLWSKQLYNYDVARWLDGDPTHRRRHRAGAAGATRNGATSDSPTRSVGRVILSLAFSPPVFERAG